MSKWLVAVVLVMLAGCSSAPAPEAVDQPPTQAATAPAAPGPVDVAPKVPPPVVGECSITRTQVGTPVGLGFYGDRGLPGFQECHLDAISGGGVAGFASGLIEVTWTSLEASETAVNAWVESTDCTTLPTTPCDAPFAKGSSSPLVVPLSREYLAQHGASDIEVQVAAEGVAVQQAFHVYVSLFAVGDPPQGYTAIPA